MLLLNFFAMITFPPRLHYELGNKGGLLMFFLSTSFQETCPYNAKSRQSPNTHKPLSGVHEEDINPNTRVLLPNLLAKPRVLTSSTWLNVLFSNDGAISLHVWVDRDRDVVCKTAGDWTLQTRTQRPSGLCFMQNTIWSQHVSKELHPVYHCTEYMPPKLVNWCSFCVSQVLFNLTYLPYSILFFSSPYQCHSIQRL